MTWLTYLTGLGLCVLGLYTKLTWLLTDWTAYLPVLFGLAYATCAEGMRTLPKRRQVFLALAIILSLVVAAALYPVVIHLPEVLEGKAVEWESGRPMQPMHVYQSAATVTVSLVYLLIALVAWFRRRPEKPQHVKL